MDNSCSLYNASGVGFACIGPELVCTICRLGVGGSGGDDDSAGKAFLASCCRQEHCTMTIELEQTLAVVHHVILLRLQKCQGDVHGTQN